MFEIAKRELYLDSTSDSTGNSYDDITVTVADEESNFIVTALSLNSFSDPSTPHGAGSTATNLDLVYHGYDAAWYSDLATPSTPS